MQFSVFSFTAGPSCASLSQLELAFFTKTKVCSSCFGSANPDSPVSLHDFSSRKPFLVHFWLSRFGRFTLFSPRVSHSKHLPCSFCFVLCFGFGVFVALLCFCFLFCKCFGIPNSPRSLDLDDRQGLIASSAMQQKKKTLVLESQSILTCFLLILSALRLTLSFIRQP